MKIVVAPDKFKGSLTAAQVAAAVSAGICSVRPEATVVSLPLADGGDGTTDALLHALGGTLHSCRVSDPLGRTMAAQYGITHTHQGATALIDMASAAGLALLTDDERDPMTTTTLGVGQMIADAYARGCRHYIIGIGGSATCDGGMGMLTALGARFTDAEDNVLLPVGASLGKICSIDISAVRADILASNFSILCDVDNPLYGPDGAACVFAPQKGATPEQVLDLDAGLRNYARMVNDTTGTDVAWQTGAGAAGGLGAAFMAFFNARLRRGADVILDAVDFDNVIADADLVITGEGRLDTQTLMGKLPLAVLRRAQVAGVPTVAIGGLVDDASALLHAGFARVCSINAGSRGNCGSDENIMSAGELAYAMLPEVAAANVARTVADIVVR